MSFSDLIDSAKSHPTIVAVSLIFILIIGAFGSALYINISEQRAGLIDERLARLELDTKHQKQINKIVIAHINSLRLGYKDLPKTLNLVKSEFENVVALKILKKDNEIKVNDLIRNLDDNVKNVEIALKETEILIETFDDILSASISEQEGDYAKAFSLYFKAARSGNDEAIYRIGTLYARGLGVEANLAEAYNWYKAAASSGNTNALTELAQYYRMPGAQEDLVKARALYEIMEKDIPLNAQARIGEISSDMTPEELEKAKTIIKDYLDYQKKGKRISHESLWPILQDEAEG